MSAYAMQVKVWRQWQTPRLEAEQGLAVGQSSIAANPAVSRASGMHVRVRAAGLGSCTG
jgi:hypothetical protein